MSGRRIAILGDGKMGQTIRQLAVEKGWKVTAVVGERESDGGRLADEIIAALASVTGEHRVSLQ